MRFKPLICSKTIFHMIDTSKSMSFNLWNSQTLIDMAKSISVYNIIHFTLSIVHVGFRDLTVEVQSSRKFDSRKGDFLSPVKPRYGTGTVRYRTGNTLYRTVLLRLRNGKIIVSYEVWFRKSYNYLLYCQKSNRYVFSSVRHAKSKIRESIIWSLALGEL